MTMAVSKLTCPECETVLRPAKPLPEGKKVKCPKCGTLFAAAQPPMEALAPRQPETARGKAAPAGKKPARGGAAKAPAKPAAKKAEEDDDGPDTYGFIKDEDFESEEEKENKPQIDYAPDMSIKDLRGPAQQAVMGPSNWLMTAGISGAIGWLGLTIVTLIPVCFPVKESGSESDMRPAMGFGKGLATVTIRPDAWGRGDFTPANVGKEVKEAEERERDRSFFSLFGFELDELVWFVVPVAVVGFAYSAVLTLGAVQTQNLESRGWGIASSVMALFPIHTLGLQLFLTLFVSLLLAIFLDDPPDHYAFLALAVLSLGSIIAGILGLVCLNKEEVVAGFEYEPE
jgi:predicted Zn finger-like uncharacterized protein